MTFDLVDMAMATKPIIFNFGTTKLQDKMPNQFQEVIILEISKTSNSEILNVLENAGPVKSWKTIE